MQSISKYYTYRIGWSELDRYYYGVRTANRCAPEDDLWKEYFTSSNAVKNFREKHGEPDIIQVDKKFDNNEQATEYEVYYLNENNCIYDERWLNLAAWPSRNSKGQNNPNYGKKASDHTKHKQSIKKLGKKQTKEHIEKRVSSLVGHKRTTTQKKRMSEGMKNINKTEEHKKKLSESMKGRKHKIVSCPHCNKTGGISAMKRFHFDNCKELYFMGVNVNIIMDKMKETEVVKNQNDFLSLVKSKSR